MTEAEWLASDDPNAMYNCLREQFGVARRKAGKRKVRLFGCASCRQFGDALADPRSRAAVEYMERFADGAADPNQMDAIQEQARLALLEASRRPIPAGMRGRANLKFQAAEAAFNIVGSQTGGGYAHAAMCSIPGDADTPERRRWLAQRRDLAGLFRDIFGNPFHPVALESAWLTSDVVALARGIYDERAFDRMPILADALQDAGCNNDDVLNHCRGDAAHIRGCWVIDMLLGKA